MVDVLKKKVPGVCGQALSSVARNCETDHEKAVFDINIIQIVHKLYRGIIVPHLTIKKS